MKPPFTSSGGAVPPPKADLSKPGDLGSALPGGGGLPDLPGMPDIPDLPDIPELPDLPNCLPGSCEALWGAVDKGMGAVSDVMDKAAKTASDAKDKAAKVVDEAKDKAAKAIEEAQAAVKQNAEMAKKYAELYQNDAKQAWAGLQSVVTQQAGCLMKAADAIAPGAADAAAGKLGQYVDEAGKFVDKGVDAATKAVDDAGKAAADKAKAAEQAATGLAKVADTQKQIFDSIYPAAKFVQDNGLDKLKECGSIPGRPEVPDALTDAFEQIDKGTDEAIRAGSDMIAQYEQNSIVQKAVYEAEQYRDAGLNELAAMTDKLKSGIADAIPLSSSCGGPPLPFDDSLLDPDAREKYYNKLMDEFQNMKDDAKDKMIDEIAKQVPGDLGKSMPGGGHGIGL